MSSKQIISTITPTAIQMITVPRFLKRVTKIYWGMGIILVGLWVILYNLGKLENKELPEIL